MCKLHRYIKLVFPLILILIIIPISLSEESEENPGIFGIFNEKYIDNINDLPYSSGNPAKNIQSSGSIRGWIDIVGFTKLSKDENIFYIPQGNPLDYVIIQYDAWGEIKCGLYEFDCTIDSISKDATTYISENNVISRMNVKLKWHYCYSCNCGEDGCSTCCNTVTEHASFYDTEISPQFIESLPNSKVILTQYNNSMYENIQTQVITEDIEKITKFEVSLNESSITRTFKVGHVEKTDKGIYYANITKMPSWNQIGKNISKIDQMIFINGNLTKINKSNIKISTSNLYETKYHNYTEYNTYREEFKPEKSTTENVLLLTLWSILIVLFVGIVILIKGLRLQ